MKKTSSYPRPAASATSQAARPLRFEIYVGRGFCEYEAAAIARTLQCANDMLGIKKFSWGFVSETAGLVNGSCGMIVRADPAVANHELADVFIAVGGRSGRDGQWRARARQMTRLARPCILLSDAASKYIASTKLQDGKVTTHWHDALALIESGVQVNLTNALAEKTGGVTTAAGGGATEELVITLISDHLETAEIAELGNRLLLPVLRKPHAEQPNDITALPALSDSRIKSAVQAMESTLESPLNIYELAITIGVSTRHLERMFKSVFNLTPARFYKQLRTKRARSLIEETQMPIIEVAIATGFGSSSSMNEAIKREYGMTAGKLRAGGKLL